MLADNYEATTVFTSEDTGIVNKALWWLAFLCL